ncbi:WXG100 family type VII secretion target [Kibdelosporangium philippinense]|uniref:ESAT-6-like protein n=2 Tax=Kibdelosporangium philippinense TaxID=211113 RepID=A0ABS8ZGF6_9PSEU|nr:WXG100 family type VII secretion target [Kibdelosporangium philippinense]
MSQSQNTIQQRVEDFTTEKTNIENQINSLRGAWTGEAANRFYSGIDSWLAGFQKSIDALRNMGELMQRNGVVFGNTESDAVRTASSVGTGLEGV